MVMPIEPDDAIESAYTNLTTARLRYIYATMGIDSDAESITSSGSSSNSNSSSSDSGDTTEATEENIEVIEETSE